MVINAIKKYLVKQIATLKIQGQQSSKYPYDQWIAAVQKEYQLLLKEKARVNVEERKDIPKSQLEYIMTLGLVLDHERLMRRLEYSS